jgi:hypothetical protein
MTVEQWKQIPDEISRVASEWRKNAQAAEMPEDSCCVEFDADLEVRVQAFYACEDGGWDVRYDKIKGPSWSVSCNYERGPILRWFPAQDVWLYSRQYAESCSRIKGGLSEAIANAQIVYTG